LFCRIEFYINLYMNHVIKLIINKTGKYIEEKTKQQVTSHENTSMERFSPVA